MNHRFFQSFIILVLFVCLLSSQAVQRMNQLPSMKVEDTTITSVVQASQDEAIQVTSPIIPIPNDVSLVARMPPMKQVVFLSNLMKNYFNDRELYVTDTSQMVESMKYHSNYLSVHAS